MQSIVSCIERGREEAFYEQTDGKQLEEGPAKGPPPKKKEKKRKGGGFYASEGS